VRTLPCASFVVAVSGVVCPRYTFAVAGATVTVATGTGVTVIAAVPLWPSLVAVIVTGPPAATPVTTPVALTVATAGLELVQVTVRPVSTFPPASRVVAVRGSVLPAWTEPVAGATVTLATGGPALCGLNAAMIMAQPLLALPVAAQDPAVAAIRSSARLLLKVERAVKPDPAVHELSPMQNPRTRSFAVVVVAVPLVTLPLDPLPCAVASSGLAVSAPWYSRA